MDHFQVNIKSSADSLALLNAEAEKATGNITPLLRLVDRSPGVLFLASVYAILWCKQEVKKVMSLPGISHTVFDRLLLLSAIWTISLSWLYWFPHSWPDMERRSIRMSKFKSFEREASIADVSTVEVSSSLYAQLASETITYYTASNPPPVPPTVIMVTSAIVVCIALWMYRDRFSRFGRPFRSQLSRKPSTRKEMTTAEPMLPQHKPPERSSRA